MVTFFKQPKREQDAQNHFLTELERIVALSSEAQQIELSNQYSKREQDVLNLLAQTLNEHTRKQKKLNKLMKTIATATKSGTFFCEVPSGDFMDPTTTMIFNEDFRQMLGYFTEEELPNHPSSILKFTPEHLHEKSGKDIEEGYARKGDEFTIYSEAITKSGDVLNFEIHTHPFYDEKGKLIESIGVAIDVTDRQKQIDSIESLALKSETINQLIEEAPWSADFSDEAAIQMGGRIEYSPQFLRLLGYSGQSALPETSQAFIQSIHPEDQAYTQQMLGQVMQMPNQTTDVNFRVKHFDGHYMNVRNRMHLITKEDGSPQQLIAVMRDMTLEEREKEKAEHMRAQIDNLSSGISEILSGVHSITMQAQDLAKAQESSVKAADAAQQSAESTREISALIRGIAEEINLLGLNAAIESARAGEHGKGFAVVADQVRKLAISSSDATGDIEVSLEEMKQLIIVILNHMDQISELISTQAALTEEVNASVDEINELGKQLVQIAEQ